MKAFCLIFTLLCAIQSILAYPRPDFAINGKVSGSETVRSTSTDLNDEIIKIGEKTITLTSGYGTLTTVSYALQSVGDDIVSTAGGLAGQLISLATDASGNVETVYGNIATAISRLKTRFDSGLTSTIQTITRKTGTNDIKNQFGDAFKNVKITLDALQAALNTLKSDVNAATSKGGSAAVIRANIPVQDVNAVITQIRNLRARAQLITFVINSSLDNLQLVDQFVIDMQVEVGRGLNTYLSSIAAFQVNLREDGKNVYKKFVELANTERFGPHTYDVLVQMVANDQSLPLLQQIFNMDAVYFFLNTQLSIKIIPAFNKYAEDAGQLITNVDSKIASSLCTAIQTVSKVQIANAAHSDFCFSKHAPRIFSQVGLTLDAFELCFEKEITRLMKLVPIVDRINTQLMFNYDGFTNSLKLCVDISSVAKEGACYTALTPYFGKLTEQAKLIQNDVLNLITAETKASYNRLGACLYTVLSSMVVTGQGITTAANACLTSGPVP